jgi:hypothetical protein
MVYIPYRTVRIGKAEKKNSAIGACKVLTNPLSIDDWGTHIKTQCDGSDL